MSMNTIMKNNTKNVRQCFFDFDEGLIKEEIVLVEKPEKLCKETPSTTYFKSNLDEITRKNLFKNDGKDKRYTSFLSQITIILRRNPEKNDYELIEEEQGKKAYVQKFRRYSEALENFAYWVETIDEDSL